MKINGREIKLIIFDLDGTLLDSSHVWANVDKNFFAKRKIDMPKDYGKIIGPLGIEKASEYTKKTFNLEESTEEIIQEWENETLHLYESSVNLKPHAKTFLNLAKDLGCILTVATANNEKCFLPCLKRNQIVEYFSSIHDVKNYPNGKNDVSIYLDIANKYQVDPNEILVIEDISIAIKVCKEKGFITCAIFEKTSNEEEEKKALADIYINDFKDLIDLTNKGEIYEKN